MSFNSFEFILFLITTLFIYYNSNNKHWQIWILILASLFFYAFQLPELLLVLLPSAVVNVIASYQIEFGKPSLRKLIAALGVVANISLLCFFKYAPVMVKLKEPYGAFAGFMWHIGFPLGLSFYTFEGISLLVDVYKGTTDNKTSLVDRSFSKHMRNSLLFICFFPHLVSGPILKAHTFIPQVGLKKFSTIQWEQVFRNLVMGYFLKMVVADNLKEFTFWASAPYFQVFSSANLLLLPYAFMFQIFADFAGYSLIAVGLAELFGYQLIQNFNFPLISSSFREFWRRWNISLSSFLTEYIYIPLGGSRKGKLHTCFNIILTMLIGGIWHGATVSFALWGLLHGIALALERLLGNKNDSKSYLQITAGRIGVISFIAFAGLLFKLSPTDYWHYIQAIVHNRNSFHRPDFFINMAIYILPVILYHIGYLLKQQDFNFWKHNDYALYALLLVLIAANSGISTSFIYFQF